MDQVIHGLDTDIQVVINTPQKIICNAGKLVIFLSAFNLNNI